MCGNRTLVALHQSTTTSLLEVLSPLLLLINIHIHVSIKLWIYVRQFYNFSSRFYSHKQPQHGTNGLNDIFQTRMPLLLARFIMRSFASPVTHNSILLSISYCTYEVVHGLSVGTDHLPNKVNKKQRYSIELALIEYQRWEQNRL